MTVFTPIAGRMSAPRHHIQTLTKQRWEIIGSPELSKLLGDRANCKEGEAEILRAPVLFELLQRRPSARTRPAASPSTHWRAPGIDDRAIADAACGRSAPPKEGDTQCSTCLSQNPVREAALAKRCQVLWLPRRKWSEAFTKQIRIERKRWLHCASPCEQAGAPCFSLRRDQSISRRCMPHKSVWRPPGNQ